MSAAPGGGRRARAIGALIYALPWLLYAGAYATILANLGPYTVRQAAAGGVANVLPPALLGILALRLQPRFGSPTERPLRFFALQAVACAVFAPLCATATWGLFALDAAASTGSFAWPRFDRGLFLWQVLLNAGAYCVLAALASAVVVRARLEEEKARAARAEALRARAELDAFRARMNPHFLFNTLHSLLALVRTDPAAAEAALEQFGDLLRYALRVQRDDDGEVLLGEEWAFVRDYLAIEKLRLGDRLRVESEIEPAALEAVVPAFTLQPLVENAIRHGLAPRAAGGTVRIRARVRGGSLEMEVADDGDGADPAAVDAASGLGIGLVRDRLLQFGGPDARFEVDTGPGAGFRVRLAVEAQ